MRRPHALTDDDLDAIYASCIRADRPDRRATRRAFARCIAERCAELVEAELEVEAGVELPPLPLVPVLVGARIRAAFDLSPRFSHSKGSTQ